MCSTSNVKQTYKRNRENRTVNSEILWYLHRNTRDNIPVHAYALHFPTSYEGPLQSFPPCFGAGLLHDRALIREPPSHEASQVDQSDHVPYLPSILSR